jgi:pimeloyl-ACP methyl ester carboxylesterase
MVYPSITQGRLVALAIAAVVLVGGVLWWRTPAVPMPVRPAQGVGWVGTSCWLERDRPTRCGWLWPTRQDAAHATALPVVVFQRGPAPSRTASIYVAGGPGGSSYLAQGSVEFWEGWAAQLGLDHDLVLYDARGAGLAQPSLECPALRARVRAHLAQRLESAADSARQWREYERDLRACSTRVAPADLAGRLYSTPTHAQDLLELIEALHRLGYRDIVLYGVSYGSRLVVETAARAEARGQPLPRVVLDSWYPAQSDLVRRTARSWHEVLEDFGAWCEASETCRGHERWRSDLRRLLSASPLTGERTVDLADYGIEGEATVALDNVGLWGMLLGDLPGREEPERLPQMLEDALAQRWTTTWRDAATDYAAQTVDPDFSLLAFHLAECADSPRTTLREFREELDRFPEFAPVLRDAPESFDFCDRLGVPPALLPARTLRTRALVVANRIDPVTPWRVALAAMPQVPRGHFRLLDAAGHGLTDECGLAATGTFMNSGELSGWSDCALLAVRDPETGSSARAARANVRGE